MRTRRHVLVLGLVLAVAVVVVGAAGSAQAQLLPANAGNLDDGGPVHVDDALAVRDVSADWLPGRGELLAADCEATADAPILFEQNGIVLIRAWGRWNCNTELPGSYVEVCLDAVFPSVSCNEVFVPPPRASISVPVDFPCAPGIFLTMTTGRNAFDMYPSNDATHSRQALVVNPQDCRYLQAAP